MSLSCARAPVICRASQPLAVRVLAPPGRFDLRDGRKQRATRLLLGIIARPISRCISRFSLVLRVSFLCFAVVVFARAEGKGGKAGSKNVSCFVGFLLFRLRLKLVTETYFSRDVAMSAIIIASKPGGERAKRSEKFAASSSFVLIPSGRERRQAASSPFQSIVSGFDLGCGASPCRFFSCFCFLCSILGFRVSFFCVPSGHDISALPVSSCASGLHTAAAPSWLSAPHLCAFLSRAAIQRAGSCYASWFSCFVCVRQQHVSTVYFWARARVRSGVMLSARSVPLVLFVFLVPIYK